MSSGRLYEEHNGIPRLNWESDHKWRYRTIFIDANRHFYTGDSLSSYSMAWSNWKFLGNKYGTGVQTILEACHKRLPAEVDNEIKALHEASILKVDFVVSTEKLGIQGNPGKITETFVRPLDNDSSCLTLQCDNSISEPLHNNELVKTSFVNFTRETDMELTENDSNILQNDSNILQSPQATVNKSYHSYQKAVETKTSGKHSYGSYPKLDESNLGHHLLRKLGWKGSGGIGKHEDGIMEPVFVSSVKGRQGIGHKLQVRKVKLSTMEETLISKESNITDIPHKEDNDITDIAHTKESNITDIPSNITDIPRKKVLLPQLTLYLPHFDETEVGDPIMTIFESCQRSNVRFSFKSITTKKQHGCQLLIQNKVIATGYGNNGNTSRVAAAEKGLAILQNTQPIIYKPESEKPLGKLEVVPGLTLYFLDCRQKENPVEVINKSCVKCELPVEWWDDGGRCISGQWTVVLLIKSKQISIGKGSNQHQALNVAATMGLNVLRERHPIVYYESQLDSIVEHDHSKTLTIGNHDHSKTLTIGKHDHSKTLTIGKGAVVNNTNTSSKSGDSNVAHSSLQQGGQLITKTDISSKLGETNVGHSLLRKMGWKGSGGIGKHEDGIAEPIVLNVAKGRQGLGHEFAHDTKKSSDVKNSKRRIKKSDKRKSFEKTTNLNDSVQDSLAEVPQLNVSHVPGLTLYLAHQGEEKVGNPCTIINYSCHKCKMSFKLEDKGLVTLREGSTVYYLYCVVMMIGSLAVTTGYGTKPKEAKVNASKLGLDFLLTTQPIIYENEVVKGPKVLKILEETLELQVAEQLNAEAPPKEELIPGLIIRLPYRRDDMSYPSAKIIEKSCSACNISNNMRMNNQKTKVGRYCYQLFIENKLIAAGYGDRQKKAKNEAYRKGLSVLQDRQPITYSCEEADYTLIEKDEIIPGLILYLISPEDMEYETAEAVLQKSCMQCNVPHKVVKCSKQKNGGGRVLWYVMLIINDKEVAKGCGTSTTTAGHDAAVNAIRLLIQNKQPFVYESEVYTDVAEDHAKLKTIGINDTNELKFDEYKPLDHAETKIEKLVFTKNQVDKILVDFIESSESEIKFSVDLNNKERYLIHRSSEKLRLKHISYGSDKDRYIVISKYDT